MAVIIMARQTSGPGRHGSGPSSRFSIAPLLLLSGLVAGGASAEVEFRPFVTADINYTDNVFLVPDGAEQSDQVWRIAPGFTGRFDGPRFRGDIDYQFESLYYDRFSENDDSYHRLDGRANGQIVPGLFSIGGFATVAQVNLDASRPVAFSNLPATGNRTDVSTLGLAPELRADLGSAGELQLVHTSSQIDYSGQRINDSRAHRSVLALDGERGSGRLGWRVDALRTAVAFESGQDAEFGDFSARLSFDLTGKTRLLFTQGYEDNNFVQSNGQSTSLRGAYWLVGGLWQPGLNQRFSLEFGDRYYGETWRLGWQRQSRRIRTEIDYRESTTTNVVQQLSFGASGRPPFGITDDFSNTEEIYLDKSATAGITYRHHRSSATLRLNHRQRDYTLRNQSDTVWSAVIDLSWTATRLTDLLARVNYNRFEYPDGTREDDLLNIRLEYRALLSRYLTGALSVDFIDRDSTAPLFTHRATVYSLALTLAY